MEVSGPRVLSSAVSVVPLLGPVVPLYSTQTQTRVRDLCTTASRSARPRDGHRSVGNVTTPSRTVGRPGVRTGDEVDP